MSLENESERVRQHVRKVLGQLKDFTKQQDDTPSSGSDRVGEVEREQDSPGSVGGNKTPS